jgi:hypothetical protein
MMILSDEFAFSQYMLQDYIDCEYQFLLRHIRELEWPAIESEPILLNQQKVRMGQVFHRLVQQYFSGIDRALIEESISDPQIMEWWHPFLDFAMTNLEGSKETEKMVSIPFAGYRLLAKFDLTLISENGEVTIYDWKTSHFIPKTEVLRNRVQTRLYPMIQYHLMREGISIKPVKLPSLKMMYWFPAFPDQPYEVEYNLDQYHDDTEYLNRMIGEIISKSEEQFIQTNDSGKCSFCRYRSLCDRGTSAGELTGLENGIFEEDIFG